MKGYSVVSAVCAGTGLGVGIFEVPGGAVTARAVLINKHRWNKLPPATRLCTRCVDEPTNHEGLYCPQCAHLVASYEHMSRKYPNMLRSDVPLNYFYEVGQRVKLVRRQNWCGTDYDCPHLDVGTEGVITRFSAKTDDRGYGIPNSGFLVEFRELNPRHSTIRMEREDIAPISHSLSAAQTE